MSHNEEKTIVDRLHTNFIDVVSFLKDKGEISFQVATEENFRKALLLAAASYFERRICDDIIIFAEETSSNSECLVEFVKNKAISRQYHTFFNWDSSNANAFFGLFGDSFRTLMTEEVENDGELAESVKAFIELGRERNRLVHQDFGTFPLEKTTDEIYELYQTALPFVQCILEKLRSLRNES